jgi:hypothetical protein
VKTVKGKKAWKIKKNDVFGEISLDVFGKFVQIPKCFVQKIILYSRCSGSNLPGVKRKARYE